MSITSIITILLCIPFGSGVTAQTLPQETTSVKTIETAFQSEEGFVFDARIVAPSEPERNGYGVLMLGGGIGNDLDWTTPGSIDNQGKKTQFTITGQSHADAPLIAKTLAEHGFVVMYWTTIRQDDPKRKAWPNEMTVYPVKDLLRFSGSALAHFRGLQLCDADKVILLGHSLGGVRAVNLAAVDDQIEALVLLGSAQATRTSAADRGRNMNRAAAAEFIRLVDVDGDGACSRTEFAMWAQASSGQDHPLANQKFEQLDFHPDQRLVDWEVSAGFARHNRSLIDFKTASPFDLSGLRWSEDVLKQKKIDTLLVYGALDRSQSNHAPIISDLIKTERLDHVEIKILPGVGHQLGPAVNNLEGPISLESRQTIADWLTNRISSDRLSPAAGSSR